MSASATGPQYGPQFGNQSIGAVAPVATPGAMDWMSLAVIGFIGLVAVIVLRHKKE